MSDAEYTAQKKREIERICKDYFRVNLRVTSLIIPDVSTQNNSFTTVFKSGHILYALCEAESTMTLGDVRRVVKRMGMDAEAYYPPEMDVRYFTRFARKAFLSVYPGREIVNNSDLQYYQNLALYSPALVRIGRVNGQIRRFNARAGSWQKLIDYTYFHPQVQVK